MTLEIFFHDQVSTKECAGKIMENVRSSIFFTRSAIVRRSKHEEILGPQLPIECTTKTLIRLDGCNRLIWVFAGRTATLLVLS